MSGPCTGPGVRLTGRCQWCELSSLSPLVPATVLPPLCCWHHLSLSHISNGVPGLGFPIQPCCQLHRPALQVDFPCHRVLWPEPPDCAAGQLPHTARSSPGHRDIQMISCGADKSIYFRSAQQVGRCPPGGPGVDAGQGCPLKVLPLLPGLRRATLCPYPPRGGENHLV